MLKVWLVGHEYGFGVLATVAACDVFLGATLCCVLPISSGTYRRRQSICGDSLFHFVILWLSLFVKNFCGSSRFGRRKRRLLAPVDRLLNSSGVCNDE